MIDVYTSSLSILLVLSRFTSETVDQEAWEHEKLYRQLYQMYKVLELHRTEISRLHYKAMFNLFKVVKIRTDILNLKCKSDKVFILERIVRLYLATKAPEIDRHSWDERQQVLLVMNEWKINNEEERDLHLLVNIFVTGTQATFIEIYLHCFIFRMIKWVNHWFLKASTYCTKHIFNILCLAVFGTFSTFTRTDTKSVKNALNISFGKTC